MFVSDLNSPRFPNGGKRLQEPQLLQKPLQGVDHPVRATRPHPPDDAVTLMKRGQHQTSSSTRDEHQRRPRKDGETEAKAIEASGDRFVSQYMIFLASLDEATGQSYAAQVEKLNDQVAQMQQSPTAQPVPVVEDPSVSSSSFAAEISFSQSASLAFVSDGAQFALAASYHTEFHAAVSGEVVLSDGSTVSVEASVDFALDFQIGVFASSEQLQPPPQKGDPLALDLDGDGDISLTDIDSGIVFDLNGDGKLDQTSFVQGNDVFLALDRNDNGLIDNGRELFGDQHGATNGFLELARFDEDQNGLIDVNDSIFSSLVGVRSIGSGMLDTKTLAQLGVQSINLNYLDFYRKAQGDNAITQNGNFVGSDGQTRQAFDVLLNYQQLNETA